jgi:aspartate/methionine/tyrosine aminotransferase
VLDESVQRLGGLRPSIVALENSLIREVGEAYIGRDDVIPLWFGEPDLPTPEFIKRAAVDALAADRVYYTQNRGIPELRDAIAAYASGLHGRPIGADRVTVTASGMSAIMLAAQALVDPGDNMVFVGPLWPNCREVVRIMGGEPRVVSLRPDQGGSWRLDLDRLLAAVDDRTVAVFVNSPSNPTGWVMEADEQLALLDASRRLGFHVVADEVYVRLAYGRPRAPSFLDLAEPDDRVIVVNSFSKSWSMTGWRLGWLTHAPAEGEIFAKLNEFNLASPTTFVQHAGVVAVRDGEPFVRDMVARYARNRDLVCERLARMRRVRSSPPDGAFYCFLAVEGVRDTLAFAKDLVARTGVGLAPGRAFGEEGEGWLRLCFATQEKTLVEGLDRLAVAFDGPSG